MNLIVLEGPDGAGKSTLAAELAGQHGYRQRHERLPPPTIRNDRQMFMYYASKLELANAERTVFDRLHVGEAVYGPLMRGQSLLSKVGGQLLNWRVNQLGGRIVLCMPPYRIVLENWLKRPIEKEYVKKERDLWKIYKRYENLWINNRALIDFWDYTLTDVEVEAKMLSTLDVVARPVVFGSPRPKYIFVAQDIVGIGNVPFYSVDGIAGAVHAALSAAGYDYSEVAFANMLDDRWLRNNCDSIVVAMGAKAEKSCRHLVPKENFAAVGYPIGAPAGTPWFKYVMALKRIKRKI